MTKMENNFSFDINVNGKTHHFDVEMFHRGPELLKFLLKIRGHELRLQKKLLLKHNPWGIISSSFEFSKEDSAYTLLRIFKILDERIGDVKPTYDPQKRQKD